MVCTTASSHPRLSTGSKSEKLHYSVSTCTNFVIHGLSGQSWKPLKEKLERNVTASCVTHQPPFLPTSFNTWSIGKGSPFEEN